MRSRVSLITAAAVVFSGVSVAGPASDKISQRQIEPYTGYNQACGYPILFSNISTVSEARIDPRLGPIIVLDPLLTFPSQTGHRKFLIAHECAHHILGHTTTEGLLKRRTRSKGVEDQELSADCWAAQALTNAGLRSDARFMADMFYRRGLHSPGSGYPSGVQRSTLIYHCLKTVERERSKRQ